MQLIRKDMKPIHVWRRRTDGSYLGMTQSTWQMEECLYGRVIPAESALTIALYGSRITKMVEIYLGSGSLAEGEGISLSPGATEPEYRVISSRQYQGHGRCLGESL